MTNEKERVAAAAIDAEVVAEHLAELKAITERLDVISGNHELPCLVSNLARFAAYDLRESERHFDELLKVLEKAKGKGVPWDV